MYNKQSEDNLSAVEYYNKATESAEKYRNSLDDIYKSYNGINNVDRDIIYWDDDNLEKYKSFIDSWGESAEDLKGSWSTVLGSSENIDGVEVAFTAMLQTDHGLVPLEQDTFWQYFDSIFNQSWNEDGTFDAEKFIQLDKEGTDMMINGQMEHVANMIAAAEGQYMNGVKLTADDVIAIGSPGYDENGKDLMPDNNSKYKGKSMHEVQEWALENRYALAQLDEQAKKTGTSVDNLIAEAKKYDDNTDWESWFAENVHTQEDIDRWREIQQSCNDATEAKKKYLETDVSNETPISMDISSTVDQLNTRLKPAMDSLKSAWKDIFLGNNGEMQLDKVDLLSTVDTIKSKLDELNKIEGITVDYSSFENFVRVLEDTESSENDVKEAFNGLAQSIIDAGVSGTEDFETLKESLEDLGVVNNEIIAFQALISNTEALKEAGLDLLDATDEQITAFAEEMVSADNLSQAIALLTYQKELCNIQGMDTSGEVANLKTLAENAGITGDVIKWLTELEQLYQQVASGTLTPGQLDAKIARAEELKTLIEGSASKIKYEPTFDGSAGSKSASKAGKEAGDAYLEAFEKELKVLQDLKDRGVISEMEYLKRLRELYKRYFQDRKKYLEQYNKYERQYLEGKDMPSFTVM